MKGPRPYIVSIEGRLDPGRLVIATALQAAAKSAPSPGNIYPMFARRRQGEDRLTLLGQSIKFPLTFLVTRNPLTFLVTRTSAADADRRVGRPLESHTPGGLGSVSSEVEMRPMSLERQTTLVGLIRTTKGVAIGRRLQDSVATVPRIYQKWTGRLDNPRMAT